MRESTGIFKSKGYGINFSNINLAQYPNILTANTIVLLSKS